MNLAYLFDPNMQFQDRNGVNNVAGFLRVYYEGTDDRATTYKNFIGTLNPADIPIDNDGRAVVIVEDEKTYRLEVYARNGNLLWTQHPLCALVGGGGSFEQVQANWDEDDPTSAAFIKNKPDLAAVATSGDYNDLSGTPTIPQPGSIAQGEQGYTTGDTIYSALSQLKEVAFSGSYDDLTDKPSIPAAQVNSDWNANSGVAQILNKPSIPDDAGLVHKSGAETITGIKTFNNDVSPRQIGTSFSQQSKVFVCSIIKPYAEWSAAEKDNDHFRLWTIDITSIVTVASSHCNIVVKLMGSYYSASANGELQKTITFQVHNGDVIVSKEDYTVAQSPCADEFVISGVFKSGSSFLLQVVNRNPTENNYPLRLEIEMFNKNNSAVLDNVTLTESITDGLPVWAADTPRVTANGSPVITEATKVKSVFVATYGDTTYTDVEDAYFDNEQLVLCKRGTYLYPLKRSYSNKFIFEGTVDKDDGTFETITLDSSNVWTIETHNVDEYCVYRKSYDNLNPLSTATTATDISNGYMDVEFDLGNAEGFAIGDGNTLVFVGIPNKGGPSGVDFADAFTKVELYAINENDNPFLAAKVKDPSKDDYGDTLAPSDSYMWNRTYSGNGTSTFIVKKFRARYYLNMNTAWVPNLATNFYIYFTILL